jgi:hypothetical protein
MPGWRSTGRLRPDRPPAGHGWPGTEPYGTRAAFRARGRSNGGQRLQVDGGQLKSHLKRSHVRERGHHWRNGAVLCRRMTTARSPRITCRQSRSLTSSCTERRSTSEISVPIVGDQWNPISQKSRFVEWRKPGWGKRVRRRSGDRSFFKRHHAVWSLVAAQVNAFTETESIAKPTLAEAPWLTMRRVSSAPPVTFVVKVWKSL